MVRLCELRQGQLGMARDESSHDGRDRQRRRVRVLCGATDLAVARELYTERIGREVLIETDEFITLKTGATAGSSSPTARPAREHQTKVSWRVHDIAVTEYDEPGLKTENGIADVGFAL